MFNITIVELARKNRAVGESFYRASLPIDQCQNDDQRRGWRSAQAMEMAAVDAETSEYLDDIADREFWRRGEW